MAPQLKIYHSNADLPAPIRYQVHTFMRVVWFDTEDYNVDLAIEDDSVRPAHIAVTNGNTLIAYSTVVWKTLELGGEIYSCGGLANVMTFPHFRKQGYGRQIVKAATKIIQEAANVDIGMLWTAAQNTGFYAHAGWEALPEMVTLMGDTNNPQVYDDEGAMMLFLSAKGKRGRAAFEHGRVYVGEWTW